jgi:hypothetical protein
MLNNNNKIAYCASIFLVVMEGSLHPMHSFLYAFKSKYLGFLNQYKLEILNSFSVSLATLPKMIALKYVS